MGAGTLEELPHGLALDLYDAGEKLHAREILGKRYSARQGQPDGDFLKVLNIEGLTERIPLARSRILSAWQGALAAGGHTVDLECLRGMPIDPSVALCAERVALRLEAVRKLGLSDSAIEGLLKNNWAQKVGTYVAAGAALGTVLPFVGTVIGGALGGALGLSGKSKDREARQELDKLTDASDRLQKAVDADFEVLYASLCSHLATLGMKLLGSSEIAANRKNVAEVVDHASKARCDATIDSALKVIEATLPELPGSAALLYQQARLLNLRGLNDGALAAIERVRTLEDGGEDLTVALFARILLDLGRFDEAATVAVTRYQASEQRPPELFLASADSLRKARQPVVALHFLESTGGSSPYRQAGPIFWPYFEQQLRAGNCAFALSALGCRSAEHVLRMSALLQLGREDEAFEVIRAGLAGGEVLPRHLDKVAHLREAGAQPGAPCDGEACGGFGTRAFLRFFSKAMATGSTWTEGPMFMSNLAGAAKSYLRLADGEVALLVHDSTVLGGGGGGFVITNLRTVGKERFQGHWEFNLADVRAVTARGSFEVFLANRALTIPAGTPEAQQLLRVALYGLSDCEIVEPAS